MGREEQGSVLSPVAEGGVITFRRARNNDASPRPAAPRLLHTPAGMTHFLSEVGKPGGKQNDVNYINTLSSNKYKYVGEVQLRQTNLH